MTGPWPKRVVAGHAKPTKAPECAHRAPRVRTEYRRLGVGRAPWTQARSSPRVTARHLTTARRPSPQLVLATWSADPDNERGRRRTVDLHVGAECAQRSLHGGRIGMLEVQRLQDEPPRG
jgi:hypothetical protein